MNKDKLHKQKIEAKQLCIKETEVRLEQALKDGHGYMADACISLIETYQKVLDELLQSDT